MKKATFIQRLCAYLLDTFIVLLLSSIVSIGFSNQKIENLQEDLEETIEQYLEGQITMEEYTNTTNDISYEIQKSSTTVSIATLIISIGYYIIFQFLNKGRTIGKKIMKLRIVNQEDKEPNIIQIIIRTIITNEILSNLIIITTILLLSKKVYTDIYYIIVSVTYIFIIVSALMILYRNDKLGLHDMISKTKVMKEGK